MMLYLFLGAWSALVVLLSLFWYRDQLSRFRPPRQRRDGPPGVVPVQVAAAPAASPEVLEPVAAGASMDLEPDLEDRVTAAPRGPERD